MVAEQMRQIVLVERHARRGMLAEIHRSESEVRGQLTRREDVDESPHRRVVRRVQQGTALRRIGDEYGRHARSDLAR